MSLPKFSTQDPALSLLMTQWSKPLDTLLSNPVSSSLILSNVPLTSGANTINHMLGRTLQGWIVIGKSGNSNIYDTQNVNPLPDKTLQLNASSGVTVNLLVF